MASNKEMLFYKSMIIVLFAFQTLLYLSLIFIAINKK